MNRSESISFAGFWRRAGAMIIDSVIYTILIMLALGPAYINSDFYTPEGLVSSVLMLVITVMLWIRYGGTPGKLLLGCRIVDADSYAIPTARQSIIRYLGYYVSVLCLFVGFFWVLWDKRKQAFHDKMANTVVLYNSGLELFDESQKSLDQLISELR